jgi:hypothetical protein
MLHNIRYQNIHGPVAGVTIDLTREEFLVIYRAMVESFNLSSPHAQLLNELAKVNV